MDFSTSSNAKIQNNAEGFMRKKAVHIQKKIMGVETQKKNKC